MSTTLNGSDMQMVFQSVCKYHNSGSSMSLNLIRQKGDLSSTIQDTYKDLEQSKSFLQSKSIEELGQFIQGLRELNEKYDLGGQSSLAKVIQIVAEVGRAQRSIAARVETTVSPKVATVAMSPKISSAPPPQKQDLASFFKKIQALEIGSPHFAQEVESLLGELQLLKERGLIDSKTALDLKRILVAIRTDKVLYPLGRAGRCYKLLEQHFVDLKLTPQDTKSMQPHVLSLLKAALNRPNAASNLSKNCTKILDEIHKTFDQKIERTKGKQFLANYKFFVEIVDRFESASKSQIDSVLDTASKTLDPVAKKKYGEIQKMLTYLDLSEDSGFLSTLMTSFIDDFDFGMLSSKDFQSQCTDYVKSKFSSLERQVLLNTWFLNNYTHVKQVYNQGNDLSLKGLAACSMIALSVCDQLHHNRDTPSEKVDFTLSPKLYKSVQDEYKAGSDDASKQVMDSFIDHFDLTVKGILHICSEAQLKKIVGKYDKQKQVSFYKENGLQSFAKVFESSLPIKGKEKASTEDMVEIVKQLRTPGVLHIALSSFGESGLGHDIVIQLEPKRSVFRLIDSNIGVIEYDSHDKFCAAFGQIIPLLYPDYKAFVIFKYQN